MNSIRSQQSYLKPDPEQYLSKTNLYLPRLPLCWLQISEFQRARQQFEELFRKFGPLQRFLYRPASKEVALVEFKCHQHALKAFQTLHGSLCQCDGKHKLVVERQVPKKYIPCQKWIHGNCTQANCSNAHAFHGEIYCALRHTNPRQADQMVKSLLVYVSPSSSPSSSAKKEQEHRVNTAISFARALLIQFNDAHHMSLVENLLDKSYQLRPNSPRYQLDIAENYATLALRYIKSKKFNQATTCCRKAGRSLALSPNLDLEQRLNYCYGVCFFKKGHLKSAKTYFLKAKLAHPSLEPIHVYLNHIEEHLARTWSMNSQRGVSPLLQVAMNAFPKQCFECKRPIDSYGRLCGVCFRNKDSQTESKPNPSRVTPSQIQPVPVMPNTFTSHLKADLRGLRKLEVPADHLAGESATPITPNSTVTLNFDDTSSVGSTQIPRLTPGTVKLKSDATLDSVLEEWNLTNLRPGLQKLGVCSLQDMHFVKTDDIENLGGNKVEQRKLRAIQVAIKLNNKN